MLLKDTGFAQNFSINTIFMVSPSVKESSYVELFALKISSLILIGILMGLFLTFFFSYIEEYRRKNVSTLTRIIVRALAGGLIGFISFYLGIIVLILLKVPKSVFIPAPNVDSAIVYMKVKDVQNKPNNEKLFFELVRNSFKQRRKTLVNNLSTTFNQSKSFFSDILVELGHSESVRAEKLTVEDFVELSNVLNKEMPNN